MTDTQPPDYVALITRYLKLRATADPKNNATDGERASATARMASMEAANPGLGAMADIYAAIQAGTWAGGTAGPSAGRSTGRPHASSPMSAFLTDLLKSVQPAATAFARDLARDVTADALDEARKMRKEVQERARSGVRDFVRRVNPFDSADSADREPDTEDRTMSKPRTSSRRKPATRRDLNSLFDDVEIAGITEGGEDDDDSADALVCLSIMLPLDVAEALVKNESPKVEGKFGKLLVDTLAATINDGECGEWPFDDETDEEDDEPSEG